ncbi:hypothetical protein HWV62_42922 [Athelia sp. TMB]|nr:hypothetical protein HWV62_42922 [Athelia sp. TMB]
MEDNQLVGPRWHGDLNVGAEEIKSDLHISNILSVAKRIKADPSYTQINISTHIRAPTQPTDHLISMPFTYVLVFTFTDNAAQATRNKICKEVLDLKSKCVKDGNPYISHITGGPNLNQAANENEMVFVIEFVNQADRDYFVQQDSAAGSFRQSMSRHVSDLMIAGMEPGVWGAPSK